VTDAMALVLAGRMVWPLAMAIGTAGGPHLREWGLHAIEQSAVVFGALGSRVPPLGDLAAAALPTIQQALEQHSEHWRLWLFAISVFCTLCLCGVAMCSCCAGFMLGAAFNSNTAQVMRTRLWSCLRGPAADAIAPASMPEQATPTATSPIPTINITLSPIPGVSPPSDIIHILPHPTNTLSRQQLSDRLQWPAHIQLQHPATWVHFEYAERVFTYLQVTGQPGRIHVSAAIGCPVAEVLRWETAWRSLVSQLGDLAAGPLPGQ